MNFNLLSLHITQYTYKTTKDKRKMVWRKTLLNWKKSVFKPQSF